MEGLIVGLMAGWLLHEVILPTWVSVRQRHGR